MKRTTCPRPPRHSIPLCPQTSYAQQLCRQHIIAGQHILEDLGTQQQTRRWWTLAGQEITVTFNRFMVRKGDRGLRPQVRGHGSSKGVEVGQSQARGLACGIGARGLISQQKYSYKYKDLPQQTFTVHKANYPAANGVFHVVTVLRWQPPPELPTDSQASQCRPLPPTLATG